MEKHTSQHLIDACERIIKEEQASTSKDVHFILGCAMGTIKHIQKVLTENSSNVLKPNGISHTAYPDKPAQDFNEWSAHITSQEIVRDADAFKEKADNLWADTYFKNAGESDDYKKKFDVLWAEFKKSIQRP